uniref:Laminin, beta 4 n=1 Tax=Mola mola TaxID=94237 RepID=A0A3Q3WS10_MOLML
VVSLISVFLHHGMFDRNDPRDPCPGGSCNPQLGDLMVGRGFQLSASSTCGLDGPQNYCIVGYLQEEQKCFTCDSRLPYNRYNNPNSHLIENVISTFEPERKMKWWQSENGVHQVSIRLDLEAVFQFSHLVLTFKSFRPAAMLVERSKDFGRTWKVFRYFAEDCLLHFPSVSSQPADSIDDVICDSRYSGSEPSTDGEVVLKALDPVFEIENPYAPNIQDLFTLTNIRVNFTRLFTLGDTLLGRKRRNPEDKYYYSLYNMVVRGSCFCNGHASQCTPVDQGRGDVFTQTGMVHGRCVCLHNTAGENCERCQDFHHDSPWRPGAANTADICRRCNCHGHSDSCRFDAARFDATGGLSGGVCDNCRNGRTGPQCERCQPYFYRDPQRPAEDPHACRPCDCDPAGSQGGGLCDALGGQCVCKENVEGQRCDRCKPGFFNLRRDDPYGCQACRCNVLGSVGSCDQLTGSCECDRLASGPLCDRCVEGFWGLGNSLFRCSPCDCDIGGAHSTACSPEDGQCHCLPNMVGRRCSDPAPGHFLPQLDYFLYEAELAAPLHGGGVRPSPTDPPSSSSLVPGQPVTWTGQGLVRVLDGAGLRFTVDNLPSSMDYQLAIRYEPEVTANMLVAFTVVCLFVSRGATLDSPVCLNAGGRYFVDIIFNKQPDGTSSSHILIDSMGLIPRIDSVQDFCSQSDLDSFRRFRCIGLAAELSREETLPEVCEDLIKSTSSRIHKGAVACRCNVVGSLGPSCSKLGGICECKPNVIGRCCDSCAPLTFGFGPDGCKPCECDPRGSVSELCDQVRGQCACRSEVTGRRCDRCQAGFWSFPLCRPCECNGLSAECDEDTGACRTCREHSTGPNCDRCEEGYYGDPVSRQPCEPCLCPNVLSSGRFYATSCQYNPQSLSLACTCRPGHAGPRCDRCSPGFYGNLALPGASCEVCPCNNNIDPDDRNACDSVTGACLRCLHKTTGPRCQDCKLGYYGNALQQDCKECSCDRRGTEVTQCPLGSPCFCDSRTGQCPCRTGVVGVLCDECEDRYWNLDGVSGCQPCSCDPTNSFSDVCNKVTGQCPCRSEFGGRQCDECGENHFGNPDLQCVSCDCNMEGTQRPSCDPETGECMCRIGVTGIFCDECAPGYDSDFPACKECHPCASLLAKDVTDVERASQVLRTIIPGLGDHLQQGDSRLLKLMMEMLSKLDGLSNLTALSLPKLEKLLAEIKKLHKAVMSDAKRVENTNKTLENSKDTRQEAERKLSTLKVLMPEHLEMLFKNNTFQINNHRMNLSLKCGGPNCDGVVPVSQNASETAERAKDQLSTLPSRLEESNSKQATQDTKRQAEDLQDRLNTTMDAFEREKNKTKELIQRAKDYLLDEMVPPEDIEKMARAVLDIQLPRSPDQIRAMIDDINNLLSNISNFQSNLKNLGESAKTAQDLLWKAQKIKSVSDNIKQLTYRITYICLCSMLSELEEKIRRLIKGKEDKAAEVSMLLDMVDSLKKDIAKRAEVYVSCTS